MTPVVVATVEPDGYAFVYYRDSEGVFRQTAQVLVGPTQPIELANIAAELSEHLGWAKILRRSEPVEAKVAEPQPKRRYKTDRTKRKSVEIMEFDSRVRNIVAAQPGIGIPEISELMYGRKDKNDQSQVRSSLTRLMDQGRITKDSNVGRNEAHRYSAIATDHLEPDTGDVPADPVEGTSPSGG